MSDLDRLELLLRRHGFLTGIMTDEDRRVTERLLKDLWDWLDPSSPPSDPEMV